MKQVFGYWVGTEVASLSTWPWGAGVGLGLAEGDGLGLAVGAGLDAGGCWIGAEVWSDAGGVTTVCEMSWAVAWTGAGAGCAAGTAA